MPVIGHLLHDFAILQAVIFDRVLRRESQDATKWAAASEYNDDACASVRQHPRKQEMKQSLYVNSRKSTAGEPP